MASFSTTILLILPLFFSILTITGPATTVPFASTGDVDLKSWQPTIEHGNTYNEEEEFYMDSETNRRILQTTKYIGYDALHRNTVPCSLKGQSYYNCKEGAEANPYDRGCSTITRCRS